MKKSYGGDRRIPLEGTKQAHWYVDAYLGEGKYLCICDCGTTRSIYGSTILNKSSRSCGCANYAQERKSRKIDARDRTKYE